MAFVTINDFVWCKCSNGSKSSNLVVSFFLKVLNVTYLPPALAGFFLSFLWGFPYVSYAGYAAFADQNKGDGILRTYVGADN